MAELGLDDLIANGTMSPEIGETLRATARGRHPFLVTAVPRLAGKSTVMRAHGARLEQDARVRMERRDWIDVVFAFRTDVPFVLDLVRLAIRAYR